MMNKQELTPTDDAPVPGLPLSPKELKFCEAFANPESETFGNATASAGVAGFIQPRSAGWKLRRRRRVVAKLQEYHAAVRVAVGRVLADLENERRLAVEKGDLASAIRATELMGKHLGMFYERNLLTVTDPGTYDPVRAAEARRITAYLLLNPGPLLDAPPGAEAPAAAAPAGLLQEAPPARATPEQIERAQAPRTRQGE